MPRPTTGQGTSFRPEHTRDFEQRRKLYPPGGRLSHRLRKALPDPNTESGQRRLFHKDLPSLSAAARRREAADLHYATFGLDTFPEWITERLLLLEGNPIPSRPRARRRVRGLLQGVTR